MELKRINTRAELQALAKELGVRDDWHEPDNQGVTVFGFGLNFDNAGFWGLQHLATRETEARTCLHDAGGNTGEWTMDDVDRFVETFVVIYQHGNAVAEVNLATLFAFACGTYSG